MRKQLIRLGSRNPHLRSHIAKVLDVMGRRQFTAREESLLPQVLDKKGYYELLKRYSDRPEMRRFIRETYQALWEAATLNRNDQEALRRFQTLVSGRLAGNPEMEVDSLGKVGDLLGIKPPFIF